MSIAFIRVDNRLIHGQVVQSWLPSLSVDEVVVISDNAAGSGLMSKMLRMALPSGYALHIFKPKEAAVYLAGDNAKKVFVLLEEFSYLGDLINGGVILDSVNIGNTKFEEGKKEYRQGVYLTVEDEELAHNLIERHIKFDVRAVPSSLSARLV